MLFTETQLFLTENYRSIAPVATRTEIARKSLRADWPLMRTIELTASH